MNWRKLSRRLHLWLGVSLGALLVVFALTGSALVFYNELDTGLHPRLSAAEPVSEINWDMALASLHQTYPDKPGPWRLEVTPEQRFIPVRYYNPPEKQGQGFAPLMAWLEAGSGEVLRQSYWGDYLVTWLFNLHFQLLSGDTGQLVVGYFGLLSLLVLLSGLLAWWPRKGQWIRALQTRRRASKMGILYDVHKLTGLIFIAPLMVLLSTGAMLGLPAQTKALLQSVSGPDSTAPAPVVSAPVGPVQVSLSQAVEVARQALPGAQLAWIHTPAKDGQPGYYRFRFQVAGDPSRRFPHSQVFVSTRTPSIIQVSDYREQNTTATVLNWLHSLHAGSALGVTGRVLWVLAGIACALLFVLGCYRWHLRRNGGQQRGNRKSKSRKAAGG